jgi:hypothetical protein
LCAPKSLPDVEKWEKYFRKKKKLNNGFLWEIPIVLVCHRIVWPMDDDD